MIDPQGRIAWALGRRAARRAASPAARARRRRLARPAFRAATTALIEAVPFLAMPGPRSSFSSREPVERPSDPAVRKANLRRIGRLFRDYRLKLFVVSLLIVFSALLGVVSPFLLRDILDTAIPGPEHGAAEPARRRDDR